MFQDRFYLKSNVPVPMLNRTATSTRQLEIKELLMAGVFGWESNISGWMVVNSVGRSTPQPYSPASPRVGRLGDRVSPWSRVSLSLEDTP